MSTLVPWYALPFPSYEAAKDALDSAPPGSTVEEIDGAWLLLVPRRKDEDA